jgi:hypothetical protein
MTARAAIRTRFVGPTNTRPSRVIVSDDGLFDKAVKPRRKVVSWDYRLNTAENHIAAAQVWLDLHNPGVSVVEPGLSFENDYYWTWEGAR